MNKYTILPECGVEVDFDHWIAEQNRYGSKSYNPKRKPPQKLLASVIREFEQFCKGWHIDATAYKYIEPCEIEGKWHQFDFVDSITERYPARIMVDCIVYNNNGKILQRVIEI